jgi:ribose 5-phosphate isomerase B
LLTNIALPLFSEILLTMSTKNRILALGCDHAGFELKEYIKNELVALGFEIEDFGTNGTDSVDYPDIIHPLARAIDQGRQTIGIILCGSGIGVSMVANKYSNVRAALCCDVERAILAREHNNANVLAMGARFVSFEQALEMVKAFLSTPFAGGRHSTRVNKIAGDKN